MSDNLSRFSSFVDAERATLIAAAQRARALDHMGNRGSDYERSIRAWVRDFVEPEYTVSEGEVIDSFNTNVDRGSRQRDAIVHKNTRYARRFTFGDGMRLVPIESVALLLEVKLTIDADKFKQADLAAQEADELRLAIDGVTRIVTEDRRPNRLNLEVVSEAHDPGPKDGKRVADAFKRVWHGIIAADGPAEVTTMANWLRDAKAIDFVCCLTTGCAFREPIARRSAMRTPALAYCDIAPADRSLTHFADLIRLALGNFESHDKSTQAQYYRYQPYMAVRYYDQTGFGSPAGAGRLPAEREEMERMGLVPKPTPGAP
jgi:hypothetical protein